jgi:hypothetical protein
MGEMDQGATSYGVKSLVQAGSNASTSRKFFFFSTEQFLAAPSSINYTGETNMAPGNGMNYSIGGYHSSSGGQHNRSEKSNQDTGIPTTLSASTYSMSAAVQYIH